MRHRIPFGIVLRHRYHRPNLFPEGYLSGQQTVDGQLIIWKYIMQHGVMSAVCSLYENIWLSAVGKAARTHGISGLTDYIGISDHARYCYPPLPACLNYPLSLFDMETASQLMFFILIAAVIGAYFLIGQCL